jgi:hypothetical protein
MDRAKQARERMEESDVKEYPILFSSEMVRAILNGRKTQTRRVIKPQPFECMQRHPSDGGAPCGLLVWGDDYHVSDIILETMSPYGKPGDRLWVRETWASAWNKPYYRATDELPRLAKSWKPSIHMSKRFSRITLEIVSVRVERVQDISDDDAIAEGCNGRHSKDEEGIKSELFSPREEFSKLWDRINSARGYAWESNPWVWVIEFKRV